MTCPTISLSHFMGKKWTVVLLEEIALGKFNGFNKFLKKSSLTPKILSGELKEMENFGLIEKQQSKATVYRLTQKGKEVRSIVSQMKLFNKKWNKIDVDCVNTSCLECQNFK